MEFTPLEFTMIRLSIMDRIHKLEGLPADSAPNAAKAAKEYRDLLSKIEENQP